MVPNHSRYLSRHFSEDHSTTEISVKISGECDPEGLMADLKRLFVKRNRRIFHHGGSRAEYCIELTSAD